MSWKKRRRNIIDGIKINLLLLLKQEIKYKTRIRNNEIYTTHKDIKLLKMFVQLGLNEADMFKFSSALFYWVTDESILYA